GGGGASGGGAGAGVERLAGGRWGAVASGVRAPAEARARRQSQCLVERRADHQPMLAIGRQGRPEPLRGGGAAGRATQRAGQIVERLSGVDLRQRRRRGERRQGGRGRGRRGGGLSPRLQDQGVVAAPV